MIKIAQRGAGYLLCLIAITLLGSMLVGCEEFPESTFKLASDSRFPRWITLPPGVTRTQVSLTLSYYIKPWGSSASFTLRGPKGTVLQTVVGKVRCKEPLQSGGPGHQSDSGYPYYEAISVNGVTEIMEHKKME